MKRAARAVFLALAAAVAASADNAPAPLADAKQQLQQLQKDQSASKSGAGDSSLKGILPELKTPSQDREALSLAVLDPNENTKDQGRKRDARKNWLVDGYDRLDPKAGNAKAGSRSVADGAEADEKEPDPGEPDYLIKMYEKEEKTNQATAAQDKQAAARVAHSAPADPLAPFLQGWLANSPVRDPAISTMPRNDGDGGVATDAGTGLVIPDGPATPAGGGLSLLSNAGAGPPADNPYLLALTLPALPENSTSAALSIGSTGSLLNGPVARPALNGPLDFVAPLPRADVRKPPPSPADDDKKYFPQLKRF